MKKRNFTFVELLTVMVLLAVLTVTLLPALKKSKSQDRSWACMRNQKLSMAMLAMYCEDNNGTMPAPWSVANGGWSKVLKTQGYIEEYKYLTCPVTLIKTGKDVVEGSQSFGMANYDPATGSGNNLKSITVKDYQPPEKYTFLADAWGKNSDGTLSQRYQWFPWYAPQGCMATIHDGACNFAFLDGHVSLLNSEAIKAHNKSLKPLGKLYFSVYSGMDVTGNKVSF